MGRIGNGLVLKGNVQAFLIQSGSYGRDSIINTINVFAQKGFHFFEGMVWGTIAREPIGTGGFGYDPIFRPLGESRTFAEMSMDEKSVINEASF